MDHKLYRSQLIIDNKDEMVRQIHDSHFVHQMYFPGDNSTWTYKRYNFFGLSSPSLLFNKLFYELRDIVNNYVPEENKWMQCWLNYHHPDQVLDWHDHQWDYHGYICIDPKDTTTVFEGYEIDNEVGNIYIGPGYRRHKVVVNDFYEEPRVTLGFDICVTPTDKPHPILSLIPI